MRQVHSTAEFADALAAAKREALSSFGNDDMLVEKYLEQARHVEVQVFCDSHGHGVYLFERDCSVQRRHQKIIEEAPAPNMADALRTQMGEAALRAAAAVGYVGAGTVEFLLDPSGAFYFMEMNTRLQVEHPVTEMITGTDLVAWQLRVAYGEPLPLTQDQLNINGHAIEARIYAEDPANEFLPAAGKLWWLTQPEQSEHVRVDTGVIVDDEVGVFYDPMIAKLIVWGEDREMALQRLEQALASYRIAGVVTNIDFLRRLTSDPSFQAAELRTDFIDQHRQALFAPKAGALNHALALLGAYLCLTPRKTNSTGAAIDPSSPWHHTDAWRPNAPSQWTHALVVEQAQHKVALASSQPGHFDVSVGDVSFSVTASIQGNTLNANIDGLQHQAAIADRWQDGCRALVLFAGDQSVSATTAPLDLGDDTDDMDSSGFKAPMNGTLVALFAKPGQLVEAGATLAIMEAMKMEHAIKAPSQGTITDVFYGVGDLVDGGADLLSFEAATT
jgi:3-methylcrotonyl-CoA carboxylase alpha subunit